MQIRTTTKLATHNAEFVWSTKSIPFFSRCLPLCVCVCCVRSRFFQSSPISSASAQPPIKKLLRFLFVPFFCWVCVVCAATRLRSKCAILAASRIHRVRVHVCSVHLVIVAQLNQMTLHKFHFTSFIVCFE